MADLETIRVSTIQCGMLETKFDEYLRRISEDVVARPRINEERTVTVTVKIKPKVMQEEPFTNMPEISWAVKHSVPGASGMVTSGLVDNGEIKVSRFEGDPRQMSLLADPPQNVTNITGAVARG